MNKRMRMKRRQAERKKIHKILDLAIEKSMGKSTVFFDYRAHVDIIRIDAYKNGWNTEAKSDISIQFHVIDENWPFDCNKDTVIEYLEAL